MIAEEIAKGNLIRFDAAPLGFDDGNVVDFSRAKL